MLARGGGGAHCSIRMNGMMMRPMLRPKNAPRWRTLGFLFNSRTSHCICVETRALITLAEGLAHDWWALFGGRDRELSLIKHRSGYVVPDIRMSFDGTVFEISAHQCTYRNPDVRFWAGPKEVMSRNDAEVLLDSFVAEVLDRLTERQVLGSSAALRWARVQESRANPD